MAQIASRHIVIYCSSHGLGHLTRCLEVGRVLKRMGHRVTFVTSMKNCEKIGGKSSCIVDGDFSFQIRDNVLDSGAVQKDAFSIDITATLESYRKFHKAGHEFCMQERDWLLATRADVVVSDVVPIAFRAAEMANIPSICLSNFTWDFIYRSFGDHARSYTDMISCIEKDCMKASLYLRLPGSCPCVDKLDKVAIDIPLVVRIHRKSPSTMRKLMNVPQSANCCLVMLGGHDLGIDDFSIYDLLLPKDWICFVTTSVLNEDEYTNVPENFRIVPSHAYLPDYIALVDVVVGKIGYGAVSECIAHKTPLVFVRRDNFAEEPNLIKFLTDLNAGFEISRAAFLSRSWCSFLEEAKSFSVKDSGVDGSIVASHMVIDVINVHESLKSKSMSLTMMQEYLRDGSHSYWMFVRQMLFSFYRNLSMNREDTIFISRAPGRLDVMGGISDYSGSHALEMPLSAGTFVAIQVSSPKIPSKPKENHVLLNLFSPTTEKVDRSDFVSINLSDVLEIEDNGSVKARDFHTVRTFLNKNTRDRWAAFVVGAFPVLARFQRVTISPQTKSITIIIGSAGLKEGAGVSSSASLEVACILSLAEALDIRLEKYQAPILAQIIENEIVGACCGIMDQLTSFLGQENKFISLKCTDPFHIDGFIPIPQNIKFWGVYSGIKRSTASSDYTCCRVAAFMGKRIINCTNAVQVLHLADLEPDEFEAVHVQTLPESITGADFIVKYGTHDDTVTQIDPCMAYSVKVCTSHPVLENYRTQTFGQILKSCHSEIGTEQRILLGNLMYDSHMSYSKCGLGSPETDLLVNLAKEIDGVFGAKITGGGGGGTVCLLTHNSAEGEQAVKSIQRQYEFQTGISTTLFHGSSQGAEGFGIVKLNLSSMLDSFTQAVVS